MQHTTQILASLAFLGLLLLPSCQSGTTYVPGKVVSVYECDKVCAIAVEFQGIYTLGSIESPQEIGNTVYKACHYKNQTTLGCSPKFTTKGY